MVLYGYEVTDIIARVRLGYFRVMVAVYVAVACGHFYHQAMFTIRPRYRVAAVVVLVHRVENAVNAYIVEAFALAVLCRARRGAGPVLFA